MAPNAKATTARKAPSTATPASKVSTKAQQQRKTSASKAPAMTQQQRKASNAQTSTRTQQQRKNSTAEASSIVGEKRKIKTEMVSPPETSTTVKGEEAEALALHSPSALKKQKMEQAVENEQYAATPTSGNIQGPTPAPSETSNAPQQPAPIITNVAETMCRNLFTRVLQLQPSLLPDPSQPIRSSHIDALAHAMWQFAFQNDGILQRACQYSAMFSPLKLAALAKLNYLPSWWFWRECVVREVKDMQGVWVVDDRVMMGVWREACEWCARVKSGRVGYEGVVVKQNTGKGHEEEMVEDADADQMEE